MNRLISTMRAPMVSLLIETVIRQRSGVKRENVIYAVDARVVTYYIDLVTKIEAYRKAMIAAKAAKAGLSVEEFIRRSEVEAARAALAWMLRMDRRTGWPSIARKAAAHGRTWEVL